MIFHRIPSNPELPLQNNGFDQPLERQNKVISPVDIKDKLSPPVSSDNFKKDCLRLLSNPNAQVKKERISVETVESSVYKIKVNGNNPVFCLKVFNEEIPLNRVHNQMESNELVTFFGGNAPSTFMLSPDQFQEIKSIFQGNDLSEWLIERTLFMEYLEPKQALPKPTADFFDELTMAYLITRIILFRDCIEERFVLNLQDDDKEFSEQFSPNAGNFIYDKHNKLYLIDTDSTFNHDNTTTISLKMMESWFRQWTFDIMKVQSFQELPEDSEEAFKVIESIRNFNEDVPAIDKCYSNEILQSLKRSMRKIANINAEKLATQLSKKSPHIADDVKEYIKASHHWLTEISGSPNPVYLT